MTRFSSRAAALALLAGLAAPALSPAARAQEPAALAREALDALAKEEAASPGARLEVGITDRRGPYVEGEKPDALRDRLKKETSSTGEGLFLFNAEGWLKDLTVKLERPRPMTMRTRTAEAKGVLRVLMEATVEDRSERQGRVSRAVIPTPGDAVLSRRAAGALKGVEWTAARADGDLLTLDGRRGEERHTLVLARAPKARVRSWSLTRRLTSPEGRTVQQTYRCELAGGLLPGDPGRLEEWVITPPPGSGVVWRETTIKKEEPLGAVKPEDLRVVFPAGTVVTDTRGEVPLEYEQTEQGVKDEELEEAARLLAQGRVKAGDPAPAFELPDPKGKTYRPSDFRDRTLVLAWYSGRLRNAEEVGQALKKLADDYRKRGIQFLVLIGSEDGDWKKTAEALRKRFGWSFPVVFDEGGELMRRVGLLAALPKVAVIDRTGKLAYAQPGLEPEELSALLDRLAEKK